MGCVDVYAHSYIYLSWLHSELGKTYSLPTPIILHIPNCYLSIMYTVLVHPKGINIALHTLRGLILHTWQCDIKNNCPRKLCKRDIKGNI